MSALLTKCTVKGFVFRGHFCNRRCYGLPSKSHEEIRHLNVKVSTETPKNVLQKFVHLNFSLL